MIDQFLSLSTFSILVKNKKHRVFIHRLIIFSKDYVTMMTRCFLHANKIVEANPNQGKAILINPQQFELAFLSDG